MIVAYRCLLKTKSKDWLEGLNWMLWAILGALLPLILTGFVLLCLRRNIGLGTFADNGEFGLYAASFLASAMYLVVKDSRAFPSRNTLTWIISIASVLSSALYVVMSLINTLGQNGGTVGGVAELLKVIDFNFVRYFGVVVLAGACVLSYLVVVIDNYNVDPQNASKEDYNSLEKGFDELASGTQGGK